VKIVLWHGYLLGGTGSNVYTRSLAREWSRGGHEVVVLSQEPQPERYDLGGARTERPDAGRLLPVFVHDRYEGHDVKLLQDCDPAELDAWVEANAAAVRAELPADAVLCNHVLLGGPVGAASGARFAVKAHGSELEYSMRGNERLAAWGRETLARADATFVGSAHIREVLEDVVGAVDNVLEVPPGVDVDEWRPRPRDEALAGLLEEARRDPPNPGNTRERLPDEGNAARLGAHLAGEGPTVVYVGKLSREKGVGLFLEAVGRLGVRAVVVGFGPERAALEARAGPTVLFTGPLEHRHLGPLWALADVSVTPSVFPEAFGMVAAEAASCGLLPLSANHSGMAEVTATLRPALPEPLRPLLSFDVGPGAVREIAEKLVTWLELDPSEREAAGAALAAEAARRYSWESVAEGVIAAAAADGIVPAS
jgi:glycosyltransferase involved in cell wall biosynthesis